MRSSRAEGGMIWIGIFWLAFAAFVLELAHRAPHREDLE